MLLCLAPCALMQPARIPLRKLLHPNLMMDHYERSAIVPHRLCENLVLCDPGAPLEPFPADNTNDSVQARLQLFWRMSVPYFERAEGAKLNLGLMLLLVLINSGISVIFSYVGRDFYSALSAKDQALFLEKTANFALGLAVATPLTVLYKFQRQRLALNWRQWMTAELAHQYYSEQAYYKLEVAREVDNPDQRITEDVAAFTKVSLDFAITLMTAIIDLASFSGILYSIYPDLFYAIFAYAGFGSLITLRLGRTLVGQNAQQLLREADLRYSLVRLRENAESIAFYRGEPQEAAEVESRLGAAVTNKRMILQTQRNLEFFTTGYSYLVQILPVLVVSPLYFSGSIELGVITQSTGAFNHVLNDLSVIVNQFESISAFSAGLGRLGTFVERMEAYHASDTNLTFRLSNEKLAQLAPAPPLVSDIEPTPRWRGLLSSRGDRGREEELVEASINHSDAGPSVHLLAGAPTGMLAIGLTM